MNTKKWSSTEPRGESERPCSHALLLQHTFSKSGRFVSPPNLSPPWYFHSTNRPIIKLFGPGHFPFTREDLVLFDFEPVCKSIRDESNIFTIKCYRVIFAQTTRNHRKKQYKKYKVARLNQRVYPSFVLTRPQRGKLTT